MPRVSVIMPAHDSAATIEHALRSVVAQGFADWEAVVADDASADDGAERAAAVDPRVRVTRSPRNLGPAGARNLALREATGELVAFLDADDWWMPQYLERQVGLYDAERARPGKPVGLVACDARVAGPGGDLLEGTTYRDLFRRPSPVSLERLLRRNVIFVSALVPRAVGERVGWFDEALFGTEDHDLWLKILDSGHRPVLNPEPLAVYRRTDASISRNVARQAHNNQKTLRAALERGRLTPRQRRVARAEIRYNRALQAVAAAAFDRKPPPLRELPNAAWIALSRPDHWGDWLRALR